MRKKSLISTMLLIVSISTFAGGLLTNTNQNIAFLRNPARDASIEIDAVYSNPAGLAFLKKDGFHISLNGQSAFQTREITSTFAPFAANADGWTKSDNSRYYKGEASAPFIPSVQAAYKRGDWTFSGSFAVTGGGGKATFNEGLASFESIVSMVPVLVNGLSQLYPALKPYQMDRYAVDSHMQGKQYIFGLQLGATYKITDYLSAFVGARMNYVSNSYFGYLRDIKVGLKGSEAMMPASTLFSGLASQLPNGDLKDKAELLAEATKDKELDCKQTGWGVTPIIGADFKMGKWNVGVKYEFNTKLNVENKTTINTTGFKDYDNGINTPNDIPSLLTVGVSYEILPVLRASVGYHHFFDTHAKMADGKQNYLKQGTNEYLGGIEWDVCKWAQVSAGMQRTHYGLDDRFMSDISFNVSSYSFGFGAGFNLTEDLKLNIAYFWTNYEDYERSSDTYNDMPQKLQNIGVPESIAQLAKAPGKDVFTRTNKVFGIGLNYRF